MLTMATRKVARGFRVSAVLFTAAVVGGALPGFGTGYWRGGDGSYNDNLMWAFDTIPAAKESAYFTHGTRFDPPDERTSRVQLPADGVFLNQVLLGEPDEEWAGESGVKDTCAVTFVGPSALYLQTLQYSGASAGRDMTFEDVDIVFTNHLEKTGSDGGFRGYGLMRFKNSSFWMPESSHYFRVYEKANLVLDDSHLDLYSFSYGADSRLNLKSGSLTFTRRTTALDGTNIVVRNALVRNSGGVGCLTKEWLPASTGGVFQVNGKDLSNAFAPYLEGGEAIALRGTLMATNSYQYRAIVKITNSCSFYGRGALIAGQLNFSTGTSVDFDLANVAIDYRISAPADAPLPVVRMLHGGRFSAFETMPASTRAFDLTVPIRLYGHWTLDPIDIYTGTPRPLKLSNYWWFCNRSGIEYARGVVQEAFGVVPVRFRRYVLGDGATVVGLGSGVPSVRRIHDLKLGAGATLSVGTYDMYLQVAGDVDVAPTATITNRIRTSGISADQVRPVFASLADEPPSGNFVVADSLAGGSLKWVGGSAYYSTGNASYTTNNNSYWCGLASGNWSDVGNWGRAYKPDAGNGATFTGEYRTIVTNDVDNCKALHLSYLNNAAPYIIRGKPLTLTRADVGPASAAVMSSGEFPFVVECKLISGAASGDLGTTVMNANGLIALKGGFSASARFVPSGTTVIGGDCTCAQLVITNSSKQLLIGDYRTIIPNPEYKRYYQNYTELTVAKGGRLTVSAQQEANSCTGSLWIAAGGEARVSGVWEWNDYSAEHQVDGVLDLDATVCGNASQGYYGSGLLKVKTTDGSGGASLDFGEGLVLAPSSSAWGTMPLRFHDRATISNATDWTYAVASGLVAGSPGAWLVVDGAGTTTIDASIVGVACNLEKRGSGTLRLAGDAPGLAARGCALVLRDGVFAFERPLRAFDFEASPGATLAFAVADGAVVGLFVDGDVDLEGVRLQPADAAAADAVAGRTFHPFVTVARDSVLTGTPVLPAGYAMKVVRNADDTTSLCVRKRLGVILIVK